jgi:hypothetical protein
MYRGISRRARSYVRKKATQEMLSTCRIERVTDPSWDQGTNLVTSGNKTLIYEGVCRIWEVSGARPFIAADDVIVLQSTNLSIPWDSSPVPRRDDEVTITDSKVDDNLVGRVYRIMDQAKGGDLRATRRFVVEGFEEAR